ncbi:uncharacterized protein EI90DRAFT_2329805 [Cantharellus anzutake]|uniref:uncharacterized protein n=1 Tax=Cantharellus anzutake TaxID=1750568 RepID=UPI001905AFAD|nr:uncharacterized protein EI90DRAFT_2329805 [Cantharellus anzutake]KAF8324608.1 hypothetical protein EI90DRAFT_2329805 [Cantharellus anzutake]
MANHSNPVTKNDPGLECMPQEFGAFVNLVHDALKEFRPPSGSILQLLMQNLQGFDAWRKGTRSDIHLCPFASPPTFKRKIARDIFPLITSSILVVRAHWAMDQHSPGAATDLMPLDISPHHHGDRRTVPYWSSKIPERLVALQTTSQRLRMMSHIYYCAAALKQMSELGPEEFFALHHRSSVCTLPMNVTPLPAPSL